MYHMHHMHDSFLRVFESSEANVSWWQNDPTLQKGGGGSVMKQRNVCTWYSEQWHAGKQQTDWLHHRATTGSLASISAP